ncbi:MAG: hypothetical protein ACRCUP_05390 [Mycoplasmatales bacterium]
MKNFNMHISIIISALIFVFIIFVVAFLLMLFSSSDDGLRTTLYNALYFNAQTGVDGVTTMEFGLYKNALNVFATMFTILLLFIEVVAFFISRNVTKK